MCVGARLREGLPAPQYSVLARPPHQRRADCSPAAASPRAAMYIGANERCILGQMSDAADLARRFLTLWEEYLAAFFSDPAELLPLWVRGASARPGDREPRDG